jgi:small subunit ribosomal protein S20
MANIKSSKKRAEIDIRNRERNKSRITNIKNVVKIANAEAEAKSETKTEKINAAIKAIDSIAKKGTIHKNKAARLKSKLAKKL